MKNYSFVSAQAFIDGADKPLYLTISTMVADWAAAGSAAEVVATTVAQNRIENEIRASITSDRKRKGISEPLDCSRTASFAKQSRISLHEITPPNFIVVFRSAKSRASKSHTSPILLAPIHRATADSKTFSPTPRLVIENRSQ